MVARPIAQSSMYCAANGHAQPAPTCTRWRAARVYTLASASDCLWNRVEIPLEIRERTRAKARPLFGCPVARLPAKTLPARIHRQILSDCFQNNREETSTPVEVYLRAYEVRHSRSKLNASRRRYRAVELEGVYILLQHTAQGHLSFFSPLLSLAFSRSLPGTLGTLSPSTLCTLQAGCQALLSAPDKRLSGRSSLNIRL